VIRILVTNAYSSRNAGDAAIVLAMARSLGARAGFRDAAVTVASADPRGDDGRYPYPVVPSFASLRAMSSLPAPLAWALLLGVQLPLLLAWAAAVRFLGAAPPLAGDLGRMAGAYRRADLVIMAGGGYLYTTSRTRGNLVLLTQLLPLLLADLLGKPVYLYSQSIGPFAARFQDRIARRALARARLVLARDEGSFALLAAWGLGAKTHRTADAALLLEETLPSRQSVREKGELLVGVTVRSWFRDPVRQARYEREIGLFLGVLAHERRARILFVPQVTYAAGGDDDREVARRIAASIGDSESVTLREEEGLAPEVAALVRSIDFLVATRMHSAVFALAAGIPVLAVAYQPKTMELMQELGLGEWVVPIAELDAVHLREQFDRLVDRREQVRSALAERLPILRGMAASAARLVEEDFSRVAAARTSRDQPGERKS
jgi:colanic acid/amylovoran biosynthesis protein